MEKNEPIIIGLVSQRRSEIVLQVLFWFLQKMYHKLRKHFEEDWRSYTTEFLVARLEEEVEELKFCLSNKKALFPQQVIDECADVANLAMFIADKISLV